MNDIAQAVEQLAHQVEHQPSVVRIWTAMSLASRLGLEAIFSASPDAVTAIAEVGELWTYMVAQQVEEEPERLAATLRAAHGVIERLLDVVPDEDQPQVTMRH